MEFPDRIGVMILGSCPLFPQSMLPLFIFEPRYRTMLADAVASHRLYCVAMQDPEADTERPCEIAGIGLIRASVHNVNGTSNVVLQGLVRARLGEVLQLHPYRVQQMHPLESVPAEPEVTEEWVPRILDLVEARLRLGTQTPLAVIAQLAGATRLKAPVRVEDCLKPLRRVEDPGDLADLVTHLLLPDPGMRQSILQTLDVGERLRQVAHFLVGEVARLQKSSAP